LRVAIVRESVVLLGARVLPQLNTFFFDERSFYYCCSNEMVQRKMFLNEDAPSGRQEMEHKAHWNHETRNRHHFVFALDSCTNIKTRTKKHTLFFFFFFEPLIIPSATSFVVVGGRMCRNQCWKNLACENMGVATIQGRICQNKSLTTFFEFFSSRTKVTTTLLSCAASSSRSVSVKPVTAHLEEPYLEIPTIMTTFLPVFRSLTQQALALLASPSQNSH
jgi:hypothetical protein